MSTPILSLLPQPVQPTTTAYVTPAQLRYYPTWMDLDNLVPGGASGTGQDDALADVLLAASRWADDICEGMRLGAHLVTGETAQATSSRLGRVTLKPADIPVVAVTSVAYGWDWGSQTTLSLGAGVVTNSGNGRLVSFLPYGGQQFTGPAIQFGGGPAGTGPVFVTWSYVAGYAATALSASCAAGAGSVTVADPAGIMPGQVLRVYDAGATGAGATEAVTVAATYVPQIPTAPPTATSVPLAGVTAFAHTAGTGVSGMPREITQAVIALATALLMRRDVTEEAPVSEFGPAARRSDSPHGGESGGLVEEAERWLSRFRPVWRS